MKTSKSLSTILFFFLINSASLLNAQSISSYTRLINKTDSLISTTFALVNKEADTSNSASPNIKSMNEENCKQLNIAIIPELEKKLIVEFGGDENINNQIHPFIVSLKECVDALQKLTIDKLYKIDNFNNYNSAFLFKELAKGNLFRSLGNISTDRKRFTLSLSYGVLINDMGTQIQAALRTSGWVSGGDPVIFNSGNAFLDFKFDYKVADKFSLGFGIHNMPQYGASGYKSYTDTTQPIQTASEYLKGNSIGLNCDYILKKVKASGYGIEAKLGLGIDYNFYTVKQDISQRLNYSNFNQQLIVYNLNMASNEYQLHSLGLNINGSANFHFNKNFSLQLGLAYYLDFGEDVPAQIFQNLEIEQHTLHYNALTSNLGFAVHF